MSAELDRDRIMKLDLTKDIALWKFKMISYMEAMDLYKYIEKRDVEVKNEAYNTSITSVAVNTADVKPTNRDNAILKNIIIKNISNELIVEIMTKYGTEGTPQQIWYYLLNKFESTSVAKKAHLQVVLQEMRLKPSESIDTLVRRINEVCMQLQIVGEIISDSRKVLVLTTAVKSDYKSLVESIYLQDNLSFDQVALKLKEAQERRNLDLDTDSKQETANYTNNKNNNNNNNYNNSNNHNYGNDRPDQRHKGHNHDRSFNRNNYNHDSSSSSSSSSDRNACSSCGKLGHYYKDCNVYIKKMKCNNCGKVGHIRIACKVKPHDNKDRQEKAYLSKKEEVVLNAEVSDVSMKDKFVFDTGATTHTCNNEKLITQWNNQSANIKVMVANNKKVDVNKTGSISLKLGALSASLNNVAYSSEFAANLISIGKITDRKEEVTFTNKEVLLKDVEGKVYRIGIRAPNGLWIVNNESSVALNHMQELQVKLDSTNPELWHYRLGHIPIKELESLSKVVNGLEKCNCKIRSDKQLICDGCEAGKAHRQSFAGTISKAKNKLDVWHTDLSGPFPTSIDGYKYVSLITDEAVDYVLCDLLAAKSEAGSRLINHMNQAETQQNMKLKELHHDGALEYKTEELKGYLIKKGIKQTITLPHTPQHNGVAERKNRTITETARSMLHQANLPVEFWSFAIRYAVYIRNKVLSKKSSNKTPEELWLGSRPNLYYIRVFGCDAYIHVRDDLRKKMDSKAVRGIFLGCDEGRKCYIVYAVETGKIVYSRDVKCYETSFTFAKQIKEMYQKGEVGSTFIDYSFLDSNNSINNGHIRIPEPTVVESQEEKKVVELKEATAPRPLSNSISNYYQLLDQIDEESNDNSSDSDYVDRNENKNDSVSTTTQSLRRSSRINKGIRTPRLNEELELDQYNKGVGVEQLFYAFTAGTVSDVPILVDTNPKTYEEAMSSSESSKWKEGISKEVSSLIKYKVFEECELPPNKQAIGCRWLFTKKFNKEGEVERYKARLIAKGFTQKEGIDFKETFAPVMKYKTLRILLALVQHYDLELKQFDIETAFLNADLKEKVYMEIPDGLNMEKNKNKVLLLKKALYGTRQAPREWNTKFNSSIINLGFRKLVKDSCVYIRKSNTGHFIILTIFVDDSTGAYHKEDEKEWLEIKSKLESEYTIKDLGDAEWILGMRIIRDRNLNTIKLNQSVYVEKVLKKFGMSKSHSVSIPLDPSYRLGINDCPINEEEKLHMKQFPYREVVGSLQYLCYSTRPDINFAVNLLSRYSINPGMKHWLAAKHLLQYLKGTIDYGLEFNYSNGISRNSKLEITSYSDSDWGGDLDERKSTTGYFVLLNNNIVSWASKKQSTVALSSAEAEYMAITGTGMEILWIIHFLTELELYTQTKPIILYTDSNSATAIANNDVNHGRTKHIDIKHHWIRDQINNNIIVLNYIPTSEQIADIHTKALTRTVFEKFRNRIVKRRIFNQGEVLKYD